MRYLILSFFLVLFCRPASLRGGQKGEHQNAERWDRLYDTQEYVYGKDPVRFLKEQIGNLRKGRALLPGGRGGTKRGLPDGAGVRGGRRGYLQQGITEMPGARRDAWCRGENDRG